MPGEDEREGELDLGLLSSIPPLGGAVMLSISDTLFTTADIRRLRSVDKEEERKRGSP